MATPEIRGTIRFDGTSPPPNGDRILIAFDAVDGPGGRISASGNVQSADGSFRAAGLRPGRYLVRAASSPTGWRLQSATLRGRDVSEVPFTQPETGEAVDDLIVTFTDRRTSLAGVVRTTANEEDRDATVIIFAADPQFWVDTRDALPRRVRSALTNQNGKYAVLDLPPGDYLVVAVASESMPNTDRVDVSVLPRLAPLATRIRLDYDAPLTRDLARVTLPKLPAAPRSPDPQLRRH